MPVYDTILQAIGRTPLVRLGKIDAELGVTIYAKVECLNPGGSIKDRIGLAMIEDAERRGLLEPGGTIIEATAGNTGVGLAQAAAVKGYRCIFVLPDKMSEEKINLLRAYGAEVVLTPTSVPPDSPESYNGVAERLAREIKGAFRPYQFGNDENPRAHYQSTGPEIWEDTGGRVDVFVAGIGTGGTISGVGRYLKKQNPAIQVVAADPEGSVLSGDAPKAYLVEGIGEDYVPATFNRQVVDEFVRVSDQESFLMARRLAREEGILAGGSSGTALAAAVRYAHRLKPGSVMVVVLPDTGRNYLSKFFADPWMVSQGFLTDSPRKTSTWEILQAKRGTPALVSIDTHSPLQDAVDIMRNFGISQLPVVESGQTVGSLNEVMLVKLLHDGVDVSGLHVSDVMGKPLPQVEADTDILEPYRLLLAGHSGVVVMRRGKTVGFLSRFDLVSFWMDRGETDGGGI